MTAKKIVVAAVALAFLCAGAGVASAAGKKGKAAAKMPKQPAAFGEYDACLGKWGHWEKAGKKWTCKMP
jgi:hypothetical protein